MVDRLHSSVEIIYLKSKKIESHFSKDLGIIPKLLKGFQGGK
jgi:hypothetical protein